jgi:hypothetical protein
VAVREYHTNDKEAREFSKKLLGRGGFIPYRPPQMSGEPGKTEELEAKPDKKKE